MNSHQRGNVRRTEMLNFKRVSKRDNVLYCISTTMPEKELIRGPTERACQKENI